MNSDPLLNQLCQLAEKLAEKNIRLIVGGGYGLLLKANHIRRMGARTRLEQIPLARSTGDVDIFLNTEVIIDKDNMAAIRQALDDLKYSPVPGSEFYQFFREIQIGGVARKLKFDFLAAPVLGEQASLVKADARRIRPRGAAPESPMHAHITPEALTVEEHLLGLKIGETDNPVEVFLPHPFSYVLLKLFALRDLLENKEKDFGRNHAFDLYLTWSMMTEDEFAQAEQLRAAYSSVGVLIEAIEIARNLFDDENAMGVVRLKEHAQRENIELVEVVNFIGDIRTLFVTEH
jgi:hypothetical protein